MARSRAMQHFNEVLDRVDVPTQGLIERAVENCLAEALVRLDSEDSFPSKRLQNLRSYYDSKLISGPAYSASDRNYKFYKFKD